MKQKTKNKIKGGALLALLLAVGITKAAAIEFVADVMYLDDTSGDMNGDPALQYWLDTDANGFEDSYLELSVGSPAGTVLKRYIKEGGKLILENGDYPPRKVFGTIQYNAKNLIAVITPEGKRIGVFDVFPNTNRNSFPFAFDKREREGR
jgi:hypothetical protein